MACSIKSDDNLEIFSLIWLDNSVNQSSENLDCQRKLRNSINYLKTFDESDQCKEYIQNRSSNDRLILIVSGRCGQQILPDIHNLRQVIAIYVYCMHKEPNEQWTKNFNKVKSIVTRLEDLVQQIQHDQRKREHDKIELPFIFNSYNLQTIDAQSITGPNRQFIQAQLVIDHLLEIQSDETSKTQLVSLCKDQYKNNEAELRIIQEFQHTYSSTRSLSWYTRNCFLNRILNKALHMQNISLLLNCLFFIRDIQEQIKLNESSSIHQVYHAQLISKEELGILYKSLGQLISINTFFSATSDRQQAFSVLHDSETSGNIVKKFNRFDDAEKCYHHLIEHLPDKHQTIPRCYHALGDLASHRNDYSTSLEWHEKALDIKKKTLSETDPSLAYSYNSMGAVYHQIGDYERALEMYKQALDIWKKEYDENHLYIAMCYNNIGFAYEEMGKYSEALDYYEKVLTIREKILSNDHIELGNIYMNLGMIHQSLDSFNLALKYFNQALIIFKRDHRLNTALVLKQIGMIYENQSQFQDALSNYQQTLTIYRQLLPEKHADIIEIEKNIENVRAKIDE